MKAVFDYILDRLRERSTWIGITGLATALGLTLAPDLQDAIVSAGIAIASALAVALGDTDPTS